MKLRSDTLQQLLDYYRQVPDNHFPKPFLCYCLRYMSDSKLLSYEEADLAKAYLEKQLGPYASYEGWLFRLHPETYQKLMEQPGARFEARIQWLQHMIETVKRYEEAV